jgi:hypothetical protein
MGMVRVAQQQDAANTPMNAERVRRANACSEMADVLRYVGRGSSVPDVKWMTDVAVEELLSRARELQTGAPQS